MTYAETRQHLHYVTATDGPGRIALLVGPFTCHDDALAHEDAARELLAKTHPFAPVGTVRALFKPGRQPQVGKLNGGMTLIRPLHASTLPIN